MEKIYILMLRIQMKHESLKSDNAIEEYEFENKNNLNFKINIYLGQLVGLNHHCKRHL